MTIQLTGNAAKFLDSGNQEAYVFNATDLLVGLGLYEGTTARNFSVEDLTVTNGTLVFDAEKLTYTFTANEGFTGEVTLSYTVTDQFGGSIEMTNDFNVVEGTNPNVVFVEGEGPTLNPVGDYPAENFDPIAPEGSLYGDQFGVDSVSNQGFRGVGDNYWTTSAFRQQSAWIDPDGGSVTKIEGSLEATNATIDDNFPRAWAITSDPGYAGYDQVFFTLQDDEGNTIRSSQSRLYVQSGADTPDGAPTFDTTPETVDSTVLTPIESGTEGVDFFYFKNQKTDKTDINTEGFSEDASGSFWLDVKNGSDDIIGNGQEIALVAGTRSQLTGADILTGIEDGSLAASNSFASYDGTQMRASFGGGMLDSVLESATAADERVYFAAIDAASGEVLGELQNGGTLQSQYDTAGLDLDRSLSARNDFAYGDILAANVDPII